MCKGPEAHVQVLQLTFLPQLLNCADVGDLGQTSARVPGTRVWHPTSGWHASWTHFTDTALHVCLSACYHPKVPKSCDERAFLSVQNKLGTLLNTY